MRRLIISTFVLLAWAVPALAQDASHDQSAAPNTAQSQNDPLTEAMQSIQRSIQLRLALAGFSDIQMVPTSFLISAKDRDGHSVIMMVSPSSTGELGEDGKGREQDDGSSDVPSGLPSTTYQGLAEDI